MEPNNAVNQQSFEPSTASNVVGTNSEKASSKGKTVALIITSLLAIAGLSFSGYEFYANEIAKKKTSETASDLKVEIANSDGTTTSLETDKISINSDTKTVTITDSDAKVENPGEYIYVGAWGLKVKLPEGLYNIQFEFIRGAYNWTGPRPEDESSLKVYATLTEEIPDDEEYYYRTFSPCTTAAITRYPADQIPGDVGKAFMIDGYDYFFAGWQYACADKSGNVLSDQAGTILRDAITNPDNWSKI